MNKPKRTKPLPPFFLPPNIVEVRENGTEEEYVELLQPHIRYICTRIEGWRRCRLPRCRRSRCCTGSHKPKTFHRNFPPCICSNEWHDAWLAENRVYLREMEAVYPELRDEARD